jgi:putative membrane protein
VIRGFSGYLYYLERGGELGRLSVPPFEFGPVSIDGFLLRAGERLAILLVAAVLVALVGVRVSSYLSGTSIDESGPTSGERS